MARNDITGDNLISKTNTKAYEDRYDLIFRKQVEDLDSTALDIADATVGHSNHRNLSNPSSSIAPTAR